MINNIGHTNPMDTNAYINARFVCGMTPKGSNKLTINCFYKYIILSGLEEEIKET